MAREEIELKFKLAAPSVARARLRALGFRVSAGRRQESNWIFDDAGRLRRQGKLLRLRQSGEQWWLTAKGPRRAGELKRRAEAETRVSDGVACREALEMLGFREVLCYRRQRTRFTHPGESGEVAWDETPLGVFLEIEGSASWVRRTARALDLAVGEAERRSYPELYQSSGLG